MSLTGPVRGEGDAGVVVACAVIGFVLNVLGTGMAGFALYRENREHHGKAMFPTAELREWLRVKVLRRSPSVSTVVCARAAGWTVFGGRATARVTPGPDAPLEQHVALLWREVEALRETAEQDRHEVLGKIEAVNAALSERAGKVEERITMSELAIRDMATGSFRLEVWGLVLIGVGSAVSLWPVFRGWK